MDEKKHQNELNGDSPESSCSKINNNNHLNNNNSNNDNNNNNNNREQDRFLPIANVGRIMKKVIPGNGKISKDAKETVQECVSEFISFVTGEASDKCQKEKRKTINGDDIIWAITILGFDEYVNPLKLYLAKYRDLEGDHQKLGNVPKQQSQPQRNSDQLFMGHHQNLPCTSSVYSSATSLMAQSPFVTTDHPFSLPYPSTSIQKHLPPQQHQRFDSVGQW